MLDDGSETDLDLGHYERFTHSPLTRDSNYTTGQIYQSVINKERRGEFLGKTVQVIPHITNEIKSVIAKLADDRNGRVDVVIAVIGGTGSVSTLLPRAGGDDRADQQQPQGCRFWDGSRHAARRPTGRQRHPKVASP